MTMVKASARLPENCVTITAITTIVKPGGAGDMGRGAAEDGGEEADGEGAVEPRDRPRAGGHTEGQGHGRCDHRGRDAAEHIAFQVLERQAMVDLHAPHSPASEIRCSRGSTRREAVGCSDHRKRPGAVLGEVRIEAEDISAPAPLKELSQRPSRDKGYGGRGQSLRRRAPPACARARAAASCECGWTGA
jgi:hypothetical protein